MFSHIFRGKTKRETSCEKVPDMAGRLFDSGHNCAQAVFRSVAEIDDPHLLEMCKPFGGGIGGQKCLCGAVSGGVMALGILGKGKYAAQLVETFRKKYGATCCASLSRPYRWKSREHLANCRSITVETAALAEELLNR